MYKDWGAAFYPRGMKKGFLEYLSREFDTVEVNTSFYHLPRASTFASWRDETPERFVFAVKMSRYITHQLRLQKCRRPLARFLNAAKELRGKFAVVLIQLPPSLRFDRTVLKTFLDELKAVGTRLGVRTRFALEPRHRSWMENGNEVRELLRKHKVALVFPHSARIPSFPPEDDSILTNIVYVRFHGPSEFAASRYGPHRLRPWATRIQKWQKKGLTVYVYFNNDVHGHAIDDARTLKHLCGITRSPRRR